jgi:hypothetical protein
MEPLRLDPADPLASMLRWLAAFAQALGLDLARTERLPLTNGAARLVRRWLRDWRRRLEALVRAEALWLARSLRPDCAPRTAGAPAAPSAPSPGVSARLRLAPGRGASGARGAAPRRTASRNPRLLRFAPLDPAAEAALERRARALFAALRDPSGLVGRLARRFALRRTHALAADARRLPSPPRAIGAALSQHVLAPDPRPPNDLALRRRLQARPADPAAAAAALA